MPFHIIYFNKFLTFVKHNIDKPAQFSAFYAFKIQILSDNFRRGCRFFSMLAFPSWRFFIKSFAAI